MLNENLHTKSPSKLLKPPPSKIHVRSLLSLCLQAMDFVYSNRECERVGAMVQFLVFLQKKLKSRSTPLLLFLICHCRKWRQQFQAKVPRNDAKRFQAAVFFLAQKSSTYEQQAKKCSCTPNPAQKPNPASKTSCH